MVKSQRRKVGNISVELIMRAQGGAAKQLALQEYQSEILENSPPETVLLAMLRINVLRFRLF